MNRNISLQVKIIALVAVLIIVGLSCIVYLNIAAQEQSVKTEVQAAARIIANAIYNGIMVPMAQGDGDTVRLHRQDARVVAEGLGRSIGEVGGKAPQGMAVNHLGGESVQVADARSMGPHPNTL